MLSNTVDKHDLETVSPIPMQLGFHSQQSINATLKSYLPYGESVTAIVDHSPAVLLSESVWTLVRAGLDRYDLMPSEFIPYLGVLLRERGVSLRKSLRNFITWRTDMEARDNSIRSARFEGLRGFLNPAITLSDIERVERSPGSPLQDRLASLSSYLQGISVMVDAAPLGGTENGTQAAIVGLIQGIASDSRVRQVEVLLQGDLPSYANTLLGFAKVRLTGALGYSRPSTAPADIIFRPYQPSESSDLEFYRRRGRRICTTVHDVIAYSVPSYHDSAVSWEAYRTRFRSFAQAADLVHVISDYSRQALLEEHLCPDPSRIVVVANGVDRISGRPADAPPLNLLRLAPNVRDFFAVVGTNYGHKNISFAASIVSAYNSQTKGNAALVIAGASVPRGSDHRVLRTELRHKSADVEVIYLGEVRPDERNWLYENTKAILYPTSAEGFGLLPEEAAQFGGVTIFVPFGPLGERFAALQGVLPTRWTPGDWVRSIRHFDEHSANREAYLQVARSHLGELSWANTGRRLVDSFLEVLMRPAVSSNT